MSLQPYFFELYDLAIPLVLADAIVIFSVICFNTWSAKVRMLSSNIEQLNQRISALNVVTSDELVALSQEKELDDCVKFLLQETSASWMFLPQRNIPQKPTEVLCCYRSYSEIWHVRKILKAKMNLELFEAMPNILVGFGLMCTFGFLAVALIQAGESLKALDASVLQQEMALQNLIATAGGKFIVSIAGLLCSLIWNWRLKVTMNKLQTALSTLCSTLKNRVPDNAAQRFIQTQLGILQDMDKAIRLLSNDRILNPSL